MNENFDQQKKEVPAPPAPEISIRTMESDIKALEQGGGEMVAPKTFSQPQSQAQPQQQSQQPSEKEFNISGYAGPEKPIFSSVAGIAPKEIEVEQKQEKSGNLKFLITAIVVALIAIAVGVSSYLIFSKWIFNS